MRRLRFGALRSEVDKRDSANEVTVWYYLDQRPSSYNDFRCHYTSVRWCLSPEWYWGGALRYHLICKYVPNYYKEH